MSCDGNSFDLILHLPFTDKDGNTETSYKFTDIDVMGNQNNEARMNMANMLNNNNYDQTCRINWVYLVYKKSMVVSSASGSVQRFFEICCRGSFSIPRWFPQN